MPAYLPAAGALTAKLVTLFPHNTDRPTHQAVICCFDPTSGTPVAVMDGAIVTATRTAAGSALATRLLARPECRSPVETGVEPLPWPRS
jgi:ornithine cyclodeaminase/alanine dehydrogenase-like protein (mu-crystallin family)